METISKTKGFEYESSILAKQIKTLEKFINSDVMTNEKLKELFPVQKLNYKIFKRDDLPFYVTDKLPPMSIAYTATVMYKCIGRSYKVWIVFLDSIYFMIESFNECFNLDCIVLGDDKSYSEQIYDFVMKKYQIKTEVIEEG